MLFAVAAFSITLFWFAVFNLFELTFDERVLMKQFPDVYGNYKKTVPMWIPRPPRHGRS